MNCYSSFSVLPVISLLYPVSIDLKQAYNRVPREALCTVLPEAEISDNLVSFVKPLCASDVYRGIGNCLYTHRYIFRDERAQARLRVTQSLHYLRGYQTVVPAGWSIHRGWAATFPASQTMT